MAEAIASEHLAIRPATLKDCDLLIELRLSLFEAMGYEDEALTRLLGPTREYIERHLPTGAFRVWIAEYHGRPVASIGVVIHSKPPSPHNTVGKEAYIMNLVTRPEHQRQGIARTLLLHVLNVVRSEGIPRVSLHASSERRQLYEQLGFAISDATPEMQLLL